MSERETRREIDERGRRTFDRRSLEGRHQAFNEVSPQVGALDEAALSSELESDPDAALALLADLAVATDPELRRQARRLAAAVVPRFGRIGKPRRRGTRRVIPVAGATDGDLDLDRTLERAEGRLPPRSAADVVARQFGAAPRSICLLVDRSGSMSGHAVALASIAAAAVVTAAGERLRCSVVAFATAPMILADSGAEAGAARSAEAVVGDLLSLRGHGRTDLARALHVAAEQLEASPPGARSVLLLSDALHTAGSDPLAAAGRIERLDVLGTSSEPDSVAAGRALARRAGGQYLPATTLAELTRALRAVLV